MASLPKIAVAQLGARRHYQQPILLHHLNVLDTLYTDFYSDNFLALKFLRHPRIYVYLPTILKRMVDRYDPVLRDTKIVHFPIFSYKYAKTLKQQRGRNSSLIHLNTGKSFCHKIIKLGLDDADVIYGFNTACMELFQYAKQQNLLCILDQTLAERHYRYQLMQAEETRWPGWSLTPFKMTDTQNELAERENQEQNLADQIICGSGFVKDSLIARGIAAKKITVVSLGRVREDSPFTSQSYYREKSGFPWKERPEGLHILFAGSVNLRKGIPYLLEALCQLKCEIPFVCKVAGSIELRSEVLDSYKSVCQLLGRVPRSKMSELYHWADIFVLPSICEGSAMVVYEALQYGLPVLVTPNTGSIVSNGLGGWVVPIRDANAIAKALSHIYEKGYSPNFLNKLHHHLQQNQEDALANFRQVISGLNGF